MSKEIKVTPLYVGGNSGDAVFVKVGGKSRLTTEQKLEIERRVNNHDTLTEQVKQLRDAVVDLIECKGILTSDKSCVIRAKQLLDQTK